MNKPQDIKIEKGIPIPDSVMPKSPLRVAMEKLEKGDSFKVAADSFAQNYFYQMAKRVGIKITSRRINTKEMRVWRTE